MSRHGRQERWDDTFCKWPNYGDARVENAYGVVIPESVGVIHQTFNTFFNKYKYNNILKKPQKTQLLFMDKLPLEFALVN